MSETYKGLYESAPCGLFSMTPEGTITRANTTFASWLGATPAELIGRSFASLLGAGAVLFFETRYFPVLRLAGEIREVALTLTRSDGSPLPALLNSTLITDRSGKAVAIHTAVFDSTSRQDYERELLQARRIAETSEVRVRVLQDASTTFGVSETEDALVEGLYSAAMTAFGATQTAVLLRGDDRYRVVAGEHPLLPWLPPAVLTAPVAVQAQELIALENLDQAREFSPAVADAMISARYGALASMPIFGESEPLGILACFYAREREFDQPYRQLHIALARQASQSLERIRLTRQLEISATHDRLTGLANRTLLQERMDEALAGSARDEHPLAVIFLDLDGFKAVNDNLGHAAGDAVLREFAVRLRSEVRATDVVGRYGGDEFVVICPNADAEVARTIADRLLAAAAHPFPGIPPKFPLSTSVGVALLGPWTRTADALFNAADAAMYVSKSAGKGRVTVAGAAPTKK